MRPYLAIIKDSFRAAISSWVLYVLLAIITLFLLVIVPFRLTETTTTQVNSRDLGYEGQSNFAPFIAMSEKLLEAAGNADSSRRKQRKQIWDRFPTQAQDDLQERVEDAVTYLQDPSAEPTGDDPFDTFPIRMHGSVENFRVEINNVISGESLYDETIWNKQQLGFHLQKRLKDEAVALIDQPTPLTPLQTKRLNRILVSSALQEIGSGNETSLQLSYLGRSWEPMPLRRDEVKFFLAKNLPYFLDKFVLAIGVFIAILVTAPIFPQTFDPGSLNLLLSKPVSRSGLLIAKFIGGCAFVSICAVYLFVGLWLIFGSRLGVWNNAILISIPVYILVFAIYYSVSITAGVIWRNTIICIVMATLFWLICFLVGVVDDRLDRGATNQQIVSIKKVNEGFVGIERPGNVYQWEASTNQWSAAFQNPNSDQSARDFLNGVSLFMGVTLPSFPLLGPVALEEYDQVVIGEGFPGSMHLVVSEASDLSSGTQIVPLPLDTFAMSKDHQGRLIMATSQGDLYRLKGDPLKKFRESNGLSSRADGVQETDRTQKTTDTDADQVKDIAADETDEAANKKDAGKQEDKGDIIDDFAKFMGTNTESEYFEKIDIQGPLEIGAASKMTVNSTGQVILASTRKMIVLDPRGSGYKVSQEINLDIDVSTAVSAGGSHLLAVRGNGNLLLYDLPSGKLLKSFKPEASSAYQAVSCKSDGGQFAIAYANGNLWMVDSKQLTISKANVRGQGDISAAAFQADDSLLVVDRITRVTQYNTTDDSQQSVLSPSLTRTNWLFRYVVHPLYVLFPKPGEFYKLIDHLSQSRSEDVDRTITSATETVRTNPWRPFWSGLGFMVVMLFIACFYFERQEF